MGRDHYRELELAPGASDEEIKRAYRRLVKRHHPDAGGDEERIVALNAAYAVLGDSSARREYDLATGVCPHAANASGCDRARASSRGARRAHTPGDQALALQLWLSRVYGPIDRHMGQVINPFPAELRTLSADPYDDSLMAGFCAYIETSQQHLDKAERAYRAMAAPTAARELSLSLYHCFSQLQDAIRELKRYTLGYVDDNLRDGREMIRIAKRQRSELHQERRSLKP
ncbi:MAG: J domain-containing protein [Aphanocapsa feldmannii 277cV]|uniref:J domain-containing protein n=1 Tax=Aphanocapsa feldmannii 277cV TaxID=2507553 RepID=A0A524RPR1_9CHRO|nr:MAG: J domain-containing protein [Aphanocapsa feldmannii 288cV]TGG92695.1 MAG: J domain-containing protein [Aphanocapsa feldmannii 277cV]